LPSWFGVGAEHAGECRTAVLITASSLAITLPLNGFSAVVVAKQRVDLLCGTGLVVMSAKAIAAALVPRGGGGRVGLLLVVLGADLVEMAAKTAFAFRIEPGLRLSPRLATFDRAKRLLAYGSMAVLVNLAGILVYQTDAMVVGATLGAAAVTPFAV